MTPSMTACPPTRVVSSPFSRIGMSWVWAKRRKYVRRDTDPLRIPLYQSLIGRPSCARIGKLKHAPPIHPDARRVDQEDATAHFGGEDAGPRYIQNRHNLQHHGENRDAGGRSRPNLQPGGRVLA